MEENLVNSSLQRKNILNNNIAMPEIYKAIGYDGIYFSKKYRFTKEQVSFFYEVDERTIIKGACIEIRKRKFLFE